MLRRAIFFAAVIITGCMSSGAFAADPDVLSSSHWMASTGTPESACMKSYWGIHFEPTYALQAGSADGKIVWVIAADQRGISAIACRMPGDVSVVAEMAVRRISSKRVRHDLAEATTDLFGLAANRPDIGLSLRAGYQRELQHLSADLDEPIATLVSYMKSHDPYFLDGKIHLNMPVVD